MLVVVAVVGVAALAVVFFTGLGGAREQGAPVAAPTQEATTLPEVSAPPALEPDEDEDEDAAGAPEPSGETPPPPAEPAPRAGADADRTTPVVVLNSTRTSGLAASAAEGLEEGGWSVAETGDQPGGSVPITLVRYRDAEQEATARAVAGSLGGSPAVEQDASAKPGVVTVITGTDRQG